MWRGTRAYNTYASPISLIQLFCFSNIILTSISEPHNLPTMMATFMQDVIKDMESELQKKSPETDLATFAQPFADRMRTAYDAGELPLYVLFDQCLAFLEDKIQKGDPLTELDIGGLKGYQAMTRQERSTACDRQAQCDGARRLAGWAPTPEYMLPRATVERRGPSKDGLTGECERAEYYYYVDPVLRHPRNAMYPIDVISYYPISDNAKQDREKYWEEREQAEGPILRLEDVVEEWHRPM